MLTLAEIDAVDQEALLPALHFKDELRDRRVGNGFEGGADAAFFRALLMNGVDEADQGDVDLTMQVGDDVGEFAFAAKLLTQPTKKRS